MLFLLGFIVGYVGAMWAADLGEAAPFVDGLFGLLCAGTIGYLLVRGLMVVL